MKSSKFIAALCAAVMAASVSVLPASAALKNITYPELKVEDKRLGDYMDLAKLTDCGAVKKAVIIYKTESLDDGKPAGAMAVFAESKGWGWDPVELNKISVKNNDGTWTATLPLDLKSSDKSVMLIINEYFADEYKSTMIINKMQLFDGNNGLLYSTDKEENKNAIKPVTSSSSAADSSASSSSSSSSSSSGSSSSGADSSSSSSSASSSSSSSSSTSDSSKAADNGKYYKGDVDGNGAVNVSDISVTASFIKGIRSLSTEAYQAADVNSDTQVNVTDISMIASHIKGIKALPDNNSKAESSSSQPDSSSSSQAESSSSQPDSSSSQPESSSSQPESSSSSQPESSSSQPDESSSSQPDTQAIYTSKGYKIEQIDGVTYVDGTLIVNKTYGLPENYGNGLTQEFSDALYAMQGGAWADGVTLYVVSGFRSYQDQNTLYWGYVNSNGQPAADTYSARPGHSEHQTGLAADLNDASTNFYNTAAANWLQAHCAEYGFIIRYPYGKDAQTGFIYEPWHVRYVGKDLAKKVMDSGLSLEEYYGIDSYYH